MSRQTIINCDICRRPGPSLQEQKLIQVCRMTDTTDRSHCAPVLEILKLDICCECLTKITEQHPLLAFGCQGHDELKWRGGEKS
jgi:hypothetical protein